MTPSDDSFRIQLFGSPLLTTSSGPCELTPYQSALVVLVFAERGLSRPRIAGRLWGSSEPDARTRQRIRQLKNQIRTRAATNLLVADGDMLLGRDDVVCDLDTVEDDIAGLRLARAARTVVGGLACEGIVGISESLDEWIGGFSAGLRSRIATLAAAQWEASRGEASWHEARDAAEALYTLRPTHPENVARVIEGRARIGRTQAAEVAYAEFRETCEPDPAVEEAIDAVRRLSKLPATRRSTPRVPFVGRKEQFSELTRVFDDVRTGTFAFALVVGEAGIGKTRLLREVERSARLEGFRCLAAEPVELERRISLNPIIDALKDVELEPHLATVGEPWRTVIGTMLPPGPFSESVQALPPIEERSLSRRLLDAFSLLFRSLANEQPTIFFLDDLQWADETTIAALQFFQRRWKESYFGIVAAARPGVVGRKDPARSYLSDDGKLGVRRIDLEELSSDEARHLVEVLGEERVVASDVNKLCALSGRHPLYLTELTRDFLSGRLTLPKAEADAFTIPISLKQILTSRMEGLDDVGRSVIHMLAVGSKPMQLGDLGDMLELSLDRTADSAEDLAMRQLVELDRDRLWIAHDLFRAAIYRELSEAHRAVLHDRLAEHIRANRGEEAANELATHLDRAGRSDLSAAYGWTAAGRAFARGAVAEAAHFYELVTRNERNEERRADATAMLATSLHLNRDMNRANPALELAATRLRAAGMTQKARRMDIRRVEGLAEVGDTPVNELVERLAAIKGECREASDWEGVALALDTEVQLLQLAERLDEVRDLYSEFERVLAVGKREATAIAHQGLAVGLLLQDPDAALRSAKIAVKLAENDGHDRRLKALNRLLIVLLQQGALHSGGNTQLLREAERLTKRSGDLLQRFSFESNVGVSYMDAGHLDLAETHFDRAEAMLGDADMTFPRINLAINRGELAVARRDYREASTHFASAGKHDGLAIPKYTERMVNAGLGICALEMGRLAEARRLFEGLPEAPTSWYYDPTPLLQFQARYLERRGDLEGAIGTLDAAQEDLKGRLVAAWIKTQVSLVRLLRKAGSSRTKEEALKGVEVTGRLAMTEREREFHFLVDDG